MSPKRLVRFLVYGVCLCAVAVFVMALVGIWTGDSRWGETVVVTICLGGALGITALAVAEASS